MNNTGKPPSFMPGSVPPEVRSGGVVSGKFRIDRVLGEGGMGVVVAATHLQLDEPVALKFLRAEAVAESEALGRFMREAKAAARLKSEHVARVLDVAVTEGGSPYIVMEYLEGKDLSRTVQAEGPLHVGSAAEYLIQACEGLAEAHARGIVHRDIKPENLFLVSRAEGWKTVKILDFGISKIAMPAGMSNMSTRSIMGSPCYMSPEQLRSTASVDHRTDIWSLGVTLYELLAGRTPYDGGRTLPELVTAILESPAPRLSDVRPQAPTELTDIIARCLEKDRERRYPNVAELAVALLPFAPRRARNNVERALALVRSTGHSSGSIEAAAIGTSPTDPPPPLLEGVSPISGSTLRARSGSNLLARITGRINPAGTLNTLSLPADAAMPGTEGGRSRAGLWAGLAGATILIGVLGSWQAMRGRHASAAGASAPSAGAPVTAAAPVAAQPPASMQEAAVAPPAAASQVPSQPPTAGAAPAPSASAAASASAQAAHHPASPVARPQHQAQSSPNPQASPDRDLDIRMQR